ncbi:hypothetical protein [Paenibacillus flagellatus]|nr:hypothetical protein [Paenibacillus flagellatus]
MVVFLVITAAGIALYRIVKPGPPQSADAEPVRGTELLPFGTEVKSNA